MKRAFAAGAVFAALAAAGCSSSTAGKADDPVVTAPSASASESSANSASPSLAPSSLAPSSPGGSTTATPSATPSRTKSSPASVPIVQHSTCTKLTIRVVPGGASMGQEIAALQFTNAGSTPCQLVGYPDVTLSLGGKPIGRPSQPGSTATSSRSLAPGETAESLLHDHVGNCQAPLADTLRVVAPGSNQSLVRPLGALGMRACVLRVDRLGAPD